MKQYSGMSDNEARPRWFAKVLEQIGGLDGVEIETLEGGSVSLEISHEGETAGMVLSGPGSDYATHKDQYGRLRELLTGLGIEEGATFVPPPPPTGRPATPQMRAARAERRRTFDAWQEVWRTIRKAEEAIEVEYEIAQMRDYY